jgi:UDP-glucose 4-epimerase
MKNSKIFVTGAAGFIGSRLIRKLLDNGYFCYGIDDLSVGKDKPRKHSSVRFQVEDICNKKGIEKIFRTFKPEIVVHLAAIHHIPTCEKNGTKALGVNVIGLQAILDSLNGVGCERFILASSGAVYDWMPGFLKEDKTPLNARDIYSISKITNENQLSAWVKKTGCKGVVARIFNTIGRNDPNGHLIPDILKQLKTSNKINKVKLGNTQSRRDYIHVNDTVNGLYAMVTTENLKEPVEIFNIGTGIEYGVLEVLDFIAKAKGYPYKVKIDPSRVRNEDRRSQIADISKAMAFLQWKPEMSLGEAIQEIVL